MTRSIIAATALAAGIFGVTLLSGCSSSEVTAPKLVPVTGRVIYKNQAITAATIFFIPDHERGNRGEMAKAILGQDGSFEMESQRGKGVMPGSYKIKFDLGKRQEKDLQPYRDVKSSPLAIDVPEEGKENFVIDLVPLKKDTSKDGPGETDASAPGKK